MIPPLTTTLDIHGLPSPDGEYLWDARAELWVHKSVWKDTPRAAQPAPPTEALRLLAEVVETEGGGLRHQTAVAEARRYLAATEESGT